MCIKQSIINNKSSAPLFLLYTFKLFFTFQNIIQSRPAYVNLNCPSIKDFGTLFFTTLQTFSLFSMVNATCFLFFFFDVLTISKT